MKMALVRASYLAVSLLLFAVIFALIGFKWPQQHEPILWGPLLLSLAAALGLSVVGFVGAAIGFAFLPSPRVLTRWNLFALGMLFVILAILGFGPVFDAAGMVG